MKIELSEEKKKQLVEEALKARKFAYAPYSDFCVGAALLTEKGSIYRGCNIENAAYTPTNCAERTAVFKAASEGERSFVALAVCGGKGKKQPEGFCTPCGVCRQVLREFVDPKDFLILLCRGDGSWKEITLEELLPMGFGKELL
jgi:cytidine deaminase